MCPQNGRCQNNQLHVAAFYLMSAMFFKLRDDNREAKNGAFEHAHGTIQHVHVKDLYLTVTFMWPCKATM